MGLNASAKALPGMSEDGITSSRVVGAAADQSAEQHLFAVNNKIIIGYFANAMG